MMKVSEIINATKAVPLDFTFTGITTDSRTVKKGDLFIALKGETFDGHDYCLKAVEQGAAGIVVSRKIEGLPLGVTVFMVENTLKAYQQIAHAYRLKQKGLKVFAITGSNGKTSTKDLLAACLSTKYKVVKTQANFNNEIGLPMTLLSITPDTDIAVVEMGMRGLGEITALCHIALPESGLITNVGETHMELLGSIENISKAKAEIVEELPAEGYAVLNGDNKYVVSAAGKTKAKVVYYGLSEDCDYRGSDIHISIGGTSFLCTEKATGKSITVNLHLTGEHNVYNALAAIAGAACYGVPIEESIKALTAAKLSSGRQEIFHFGAITVINDAYNASPASMEAAMATMSEAKKSAQGPCRTVAVLADMLELGHIAEEAHRRVGKQAVENGLDLIITYGKLAAYINDEAIKLGAESYHCQNRQEAEALLQQKLKPGDIVLLKGSHSMHVDKIMDLFKNSK